jgi:hypothetical protein
MSRSSGRFRGASRSGRRAFAAIACLAVAASCRGVPEALGPDRRTARANADALFEALALRFDSVQRAPKFHQARTKLGRHALSPSRILGDTSVWTAMGRDSTRTLSLWGTHTPVGYLFTARASAPVPSAVGDSRHVIRLRQRGKSEYDWVTSVDHALGTVNARDVAAATTAFLAAPERISTGRGRAEGRAIFPRTTRVLGELFSLDTVHTNQLADRSTTVSVRFRMHPDRIEGTRPNFAKYLKKYVEPARYRLALRDDAGTTWFQAAASENLFTMNYRSRDGELIALTGPPRPMPDSVRIAIDFSAKFMIFRVGVSRLVGDFISVRTPDERGWLMRFRREPEWHLPLAVNHLIRTSLRHPFAGDGMTLRIAVRDPAAGTPALLTREARLSVQESAIVRWLGGLGSSAMSDFAGRAEAEENRYVFEVLTALRSDFVAALAGGE